MDISGFTAMSERLATKGKIGAEEVTDVLGEMFTSLLTAAYDDGGSLLKFGGDAMLLFFSGPEHSARACRAAVRMRALTRRRGRFRTSAGNVRLQMSVGVHSGGVHMFLLGTSHLELLVCGPAVTRTVELEATASAGEICMSSEVAAAIPQNCVLRGADGVFRLTREPPVSLDAGHGAPTIDKFPDAARCVSQAIRAHLSGTSTPESEHRYGVVSFIHFEDVDSMLTESGTSAVEDALGALIETVQQAADEFGICFLGTDVDRDGGKIILTAGVPKASGQDEEAMFRALSKIRETRQHLPLRIGVNAGSIFAGDVGPPYRRTYTVMGDVVNLAARLMARAGPGEILTLPAVMDRARTIYDLRVLEPFQVKGKAAPVSAVAVGMAQEGRASSEEARLPLIGRDQELHLLLATLRSVRDGHLSIFKLVGETVIV
jgi:class 3 adenylate cyclase